MSPFSPMQEEMHAACQRQIRKVIIKNQNNEYTKSHNEKNQSNNMDTVQNRNTNPLQKTRRFLG